MSSQKTSSGSGLLMALAAVVALAVTVVAVVGLPSRQPPDPFEDQPIRIVRLEVEWDPNPYFDPPRDRTVRVIYSVGDDTGDVLLFQEDQPWRHITTARAGTHIELLAEPDDYGRLVGRVYIDDDLADDEETDDVEGFLLNVVA